MITGGSLTSTEGTAIYWPMEGALTIGGNAVVTGGTGIEAKMGTITIQNNAKVIGTAEYRADEPTNGGSSPEGSALLLSSQMYGTDGQYKTDNQLKVNITGGTLTSNQGNAVTVYNTEQNEVQTAQVTVSGGTFTAEKSRGHLRDQGRQHRDHQREYPDHQQVQHNIDGLRQRGSCLYRREWQHSLFC